MQQAVEDAPRWVQTVLDWRWVWIAARLGLTSSYVLGGLTKLVDYSAAVAEQEHFGLHPGWLWAGMAIVVELVGPALIISGRFVWLGAGALGVLTAVATLVANNFWTMQGHEQLMAANTFFEHIGLIAGFVLVAAFAQVEREGRGRQL
jgi:uncharacterized membrane protein YphA (DoxX/SURF4 family)